jgi:hypothetical protein
MNNDLLQLARVGELERHLKTAALALRHSERLATAMNRPRAAGWLDALTTQVNDLVQGLPHLVNDIMPDVKAKAA